MLTRFMWYVMLIACHVVYVVWLSVANTLISFQYAVSFVRLLLSKLLEGKTIQNGIVDL